MNKMSNTVFFVVFNFALCMYNAQAGPVKVIPDKIDLEYNPKSEYIENLKVDLKNPGTLDAYLDMVVHLKKDAPADAHIDLKAEKLNDGKYQTFGPPISVNLCEFMKTDKTIVPAVLKHSNFSSDCPQKAGYYEMNHYQMATNDLPFPLPVGDYKLHSIVSFGNDKIIVTYTARLTE